MDDFLSEDDNYRARMVSNASVSRSLQDWNINPEQGIVKTSLENFLKESGHGLRNLNKNQLLGFVTSKPKSSTRGSKKILGVSYFDKREGKDNEDLFEISGLKVTRLNPREVRQTYPEYNGYHKESKDFLRES